MKLKYEFTEDEMHYLLTAINNQQISGVKSAQSLLRMVAILNNPLNAKEFNQQNERKDIPEIIKDIKKDEEVKKKR